METNTIMNSNGEAPTELTVIGSPVSAENSTAALPAEIAGNSGNQGDLAGKSVGNVREIPGNPEIPSAPATPAAQTMAIKKIDRRSQAISRLDKWAGQTYLSHLKPDDEDLVTDLCEKHTYAEVVDILAMPRPVGLNLKTSISSLQRFYACYRAEIMEEEAGVAREQIEVILADGADNDESFYKAAKHLLKRRLLETSISPVGKSDEICRLFGMLERIRLTDLAERRLALDAQKAEEIQ